MIKEPVKKLISVIEKQKTVYNKLRKTVAEEESALSKKDINTLENIIKKQEKEVEEISLLEKEKSAVIKEAAEIFSVQPAISELLGKLDENEAKELEKAAVSLTETVREVNSVNSKNAHLMKNFLDYTGFINGIKEKASKPVETVYTMSGDKKTENTALKPKIDTQI